VGKDPAALRVILTERLHLPALVEILGGDFDQRRDSRADGAGNSIARRRPRVMKAQFMLTSPDFNPGATYCEGLEQRLARVVGVKRSKASAAAVFYAVSLTN
jgi:hypothetical protein